jgi:hypothetical protein
MKIRDKKIFILFCLIIFYTLITISQTKDTIKSDLSDLGKMWTFDSPPNDYFSKKYNFIPENEWYEKARLSCVKFSSYCSASFISEDGLIMTNQHCARVSLDAVNRPGEKLGETGFYAPTIADERKVPGLYVDQLVLLEDVTKEIQEAFAKGNNDEEKLYYRSEKIQEVEDKYRERTGLICNVISFYNGGKYSIYGYKRYTDIRLVFAVETAIGYYGGNYDDFTYPRYNLDLAFFRVYQEDGKHYKPKYYFKWDLKGANEGDIAFIPGTPGSTNRLLTVSQLKFERDYNYPTILSLMQNTLNNLTKYIEKHPDQKSRFQNQIYGTSNSYKFLNGVLADLKDSIIMARKINFEENFKSSVISSPQLKSKYANVWNSIDECQNEKSNIYGLINAFNFVNKGRYFMQANRIFNYALEMHKPDQERPESYWGDNVESVKASILNLNFDRELDTPILESYLKFLKTQEDKDTTIKKFLNNQTPEQLASKLIETTILKDKDKIKNLLNGNPDSIIISTDPFISFVVRTFKHAQEINKQWNDILSKEAAKSQLLGNAIYDVFGTNVPPDANGTLRISDGIIKGYEYNGTLAPSMTTFYGLYDRHYSFKKPEWDIPEKWKNPPSSFSMSTPLNFTLNTDIIGGNAGSPVINKDQKIVGLVHDINFEAISGSFIYLGDKNRTVAIHSSGILKALEDIYKADRILKEIRNGRISE